MSNGLQVAPLIAADRFPVSMLALDVRGEYVVTQPKVRVILTYNDDSSGGRITAWDVPASIVLDTNWTRTDSVFGPKSQDWFVETDLGQYVIRPLGGCGCGDGLKHWTPPEFQPYRIGKPLR